MNTRVGMTVAALFLSGYAIAAGQSMESPRVKPDVVVLSPQELVRLLKPMTSFQEEKQKISERVFETTFRVADVQRRGEKSVAICSPGLRITTNRDEGPCQLCFLTEDPKEQEKAGELSKGDEVKVRGKFQRLENYGPHLESQPAAGLYFNETEIVQAPPHEKIMLEPLTNAEMVTKVEPVTNTEVVTWEPVTNTGPVTMEPTTKLEPVPMARSLTNGAIIIELSKHGDGTLNIENGTKRDAVVKLVDDTLDKAVVGFYVRAGQTATVEEIPDGLFRVLFALGTDWNAVERTFTRDKAFSEFDKKLDFTTTERTEGARVTTESTIFTLTLHGVPEGNVRTSGIEEKEFLKY